MTAATMTIEDDITVLGRIPILRRLGAGPLRIIAISAESFRLGRGEVLFTAGETADGAYIIQRGSFSLKSGRVGEEDVIVGSGTLLGESALITETKRPATATAREDSSVMRITRVMFLKMLEGYPEAAYRLREALAARADQWARDVGDVRETLARGTKPQ